MSEYQSLQLSPIDLLSIREEDELLAINGNSDSCRDSCIEDDDADAKDDGEKSPSSTPSSAQTSPTAVVKKKKIRRRKQRADSLQKSGFSSSSRRQLSVEQVRKVQFDFLAELSRDFCPLDGSKFTITRNFFDDLKFGAGIEYLVNFKILPSGEQDVSLPVARVYVGYPSGHIRSKIDLKELSITSPLDETKGPSIEEHMLTLSKVLQHLKVLMEGDKTKLHDSLSPIKRQAGNFTHIVAQASSLCN